MTEAAYAHAAAIVRASDPDRYLADLFAPEASRRHLFALHAFAAEVSTIRAKVKEPALGEIRLKWWEGALRGDHGGNPTAAALVLTIADFALPIGAFDRLLQAHVFDLYDDPMPGLNDLEGYCGDTESALMQLGAIILAGGRDPGTAEIAGHSGIAVAATRLFRRLPINAASGQPFLPEDLLLGHGVDRHAVTEGQTTPELRAALDELFGTVRGHLAVARGLVVRLDQRLLPAFLPVAMVEPYLARLEQPGFDLLHDVTDFAPLRRQWILWRAARRGWF